MRHGLSIAAVMALAGCAAAGAPEPAPTPMRMAAVEARQSTTGDPERLICRLEGASGSRIGRAKVCKSAREWEAQRLGARDELDRHQRPQATR